MCVCVHACTFLFACMYVTNTCIFTYIHTHIWCMFACTIELYFNKETLLISNVSLFRLERNAVAMMRSRSRLRSGSASLQLVQSPPEGAGWLTVMVMTKWSALLLVCLLAFFRHSGEHLKASVSSNMAAPLPGSCGFYVEKKRRFCKMVAARGRKFCGEHATMVCTRTGCAYGPKGGGGGRGEKPFACTGSPAYNLH